MELFNKKFVYFMWDDVLAGKDVILADSIDELIDAVNNDEPIRHQIGYADYQFRDERSGSFWRFAYYDPNLDCKIAYLQGQAIECRVAGTNGEWHLIADPSWEEGTEYRIAEETPTLVTWGELLEWLAKGKGALKVDNDITTYVSVREEDWHKSVPANIIVRKWNDTWHQPTTEYCKC